MPATGAAPREVVVTGLGLAVSLDGAGRGQDARTAYERALSLPGLKADAADYARERLASGR